MADFIIDKSYEMSEGVFDGKIISATDGKGISYRLVKNKFFDWKGLLHDGLFNTQEEAIAYVKNQGFRVISAPIVDVYMLRYENAVEL